MILPNHDTLLLLLALLLCLWLLTRVQEKQRAAPPPRRKPMTPDELGRVLFEVARAADVDAYRGLFIAGHEAQALFGEAAQSYLDSRNHKMLTESLVEIGARIPVDARYAGCAISDAGEVTLTVRRPSGDSFGISAGTAVSCQRIWRLRDGFAYGIANAQ